MSTFQDERRKPAACFSCCLGRVSDFGLIAVRESQSIMGGGDTVPSAAWTAPEVLDDQDASVLSDVYR